MITDGTKLKDFRGIPIYVDLSGQFRAEVEGERISEGSLADCEKSIQRIRDKLRKRGKVSIPCVLVVANRAVYETTFEGIDRREKKFKFPDEVAETLRRIGHRNAAPKMLPASVDPSMIRALTSEVVRLEKELKEAEDRIGAVPGFIAETGYDRDLDTKERLAIEYLTKGGTNEGSD